MKTLYSTPNCPQCKFLKSKLDERGVEYSQCYDEEEMKELDISSVPVLKLEDGTLLTFANALKYVNGVIK